MNPVTGWPAHLGKITSRLQHKDSPYFVWKVEDAYHGVNVWPGALRILEYLTEQYGIRLICLEGTASEFPVNDYRRVLRPNDLPRIREEFDRQLLSPAIYLALVSKKPLIVCGADDEATYQRQVRVQNTIRDGEAPVTALLNRLAAHLEQATNRSTGVLSELQRAIKAYERDEMSLLDYIEVLSDIDAHAIDDYSNIRRLSEVKRLEECIDFDRAQKETTRLRDWVLPGMRAGAIPPEVVRRAVRAELKKRNDDPDLFELISPQVRRQLYTAFSKRIVGLLSREIQQGAAGATPQVLACLLDLAKIWGINLRQFAPVVEYTHYLHQAGRIQLRETLTELHMMTSAMENRLLAADRSAEPLVRAANTVSLLRRLCTLASLPNDVDTLLAQSSMLTTAKLVDLVERAVGERIPAPPDGRALDTVISAAYSYYELAPRRGEIIAHRTLQEMDRRGVNEAILVTGGHLTPSIMKTFGIQSVSAAVVMPHVKPSDITAEQYFNSFLPANRKRTILDDLADRIREHEHDEEDEDD